MSWCGGGEISPTPGGAAAGARDPRVDLAGGQLTALAGLGALRELDLDVVGVRQVHARDAEAAGCHLLDRAAPLGVEQPLDVLASLARVRLGADRVHRDGERLVRLLRDGAVAHRARRESLDDRLDGLDLVDGDGRPLPRLEPEHAAQGLQLGRLVVDELRVLPEDVVPAGAGGVLQPEHGVGVEQVRGAVASPLVLAAGPQALVRTGGAVLGVGVVVTLLVLRGDLAQADAAELGLGAGEVRGDDLFGEADGFEHLRSRVGRHGRDAHLGHDLQHALAERVDEVLDGLLGADARDEARAHQVLDGLHREVRVDRRGAVADEGRDVVDLAHVSGLDDEPDLHPVLAADEMVVHGREHQQRRDRDEVLVRVPVAQDDELRALLDGGVDLGAHGLEALLEGILPLLEGVEPAHGHRAAARQRLVDVLELRQLVVVDDGEVQRDRVRVLRAPRQQVPLGSEPEGERGDDLFADRVERRVGHLGELLHEVVEQQVRAVAEHGDRRVRAHGAERLGAVLTHRGEEDADLFLRVAERALAARDRRDRVHDVLALGQVLEAHAAGVQPLLPGLERREVALDLVVLDDPLLRGVHHEHAARAQTPATLDAVGREVEHAGLRADHHEAVGRLGPAARAQAVAVERRADDRAVGEDEGGRAVPRLHLHRVVLVERAQLGRDLGLLLVRLGHHHRDGVRQAAAREREQLEDLVEGCRVARALGADRQQRTDVAKQLGLELRLAGAHPVAVRADRVDLAVVREHAQRLRERPRREGVGRVAAVHDRELGREALVGQVGVERLELQGRDHALVPEGAGAERDEVRVVLVAGALAQTVHATVEGDAAQGGRVADGRARDEELLERGAGGVRQLAEVLLVGRDLAPAEHHESLGGGELLDARLDGGALVVVERQERHARGVLAHGRQLEVGDGAEEGIRHLRQDARTVARARVGADRAAVLEVAQRLERERHDVVPGHAAQRGDHGQAAGILLEGRVVHALLGRESGKRSRGRFTTKARSHTYRPQ